MTSDELPGDGRRLQVSLNKIVPENVLQTIAMALKAAEPHTYQRTFMFYYLSDMPPENGAWATAIFDPDLKVEILGFTADQAAAAVPAAPPSQETVGRWIDNFPGSSHRIWIYRENGKLRMERRFQDGSSFTITLVEKESLQGRRFEDVEGSDSGDYFVIDSNGDLGVYDNTGSLGTDKAAN